MDFGSKKCFKTGFGATNEIRKGCINEAFYKNRHSVEIPGNTYKKTVLDNGLRVITEELTPLGPLRSACGSTSAP